MHEYGLAQDILDAVFKELKDKPYEKITKIALRVGQYNLVTPETLQSAFDLVSENSKAQGVVLDIEQTPGMEIEIRHVEAE